MNTAYIRSTQAREIMTLKRAINQLHQKTLDLTFSDKKEALKDVNNIEHRMKDVQNILLTFRRDIRVIGFSTKQRTEREAAFESDLGRVGQLKGELIHLQNQLSQLENQVLILKGKIGNATNSSPHIGKRVIDHLDEIKQKNKAYSKDIAIVPHNSILPESKPHMNGADLAFASAALAAIIFTFLNKNK
jgi:predicted  nucleic acid-binding Zn-ribbon protein